MGYQHFTANAEPCLKVIAPYTDIRFLPPCSCTCYRTVALASSLPC